MPEEKNIGQTSGENSSQVSGKKDDDIENNKIVAALSYLWILCLVPLLLKRNSKFAQFHAKQGLALFIIEIAASLIFWVPFLGWIIWLAIIVISVIGILKTINGEWWKIPYIYDFSKKINL